MAHKPGWPSLTDHTVFRYKPSFETTNEAMDEQEGNLPKPERKYSCDFSHHSYKKIRWERAQR